MPVGHGQAHWACILGRLLEVRVAQRQIAGAALDAEQLEWAPLREHRLGARGETQPVGVVSEDHGASMSGRRGVVWARSWDCASAGVPVSLGVAALDSTETCGQRFGDGYPQLLQNLEELSADAGRVDRAEDKQLARTFTVGSLSCCPPRKPRTQDRKRRVRDESHLNGSSAHTRSSQPSGLVRG